MNSPDLVVIEPGPEVDARTTALLTELAHLGFIPRFLLTVLMGLVAILLVLATGVVWRLNDWRGWAFIAVVLEPLTVFLILGATYCLVPSSAFGRWFALMLPRARRVVVLVLSVIAAGVVFGLGVATWGVIRQL